MAVQAARTEKVKQVIKFLDDVVPDAAPTDMKTERRIVLESRDKNDFRITQPDTCPYGYWYISRDRGQVPASLSGAFTTAGIATKAVKEYLNTFSLPQVIKEIQS